MLSLVVPTYNEKKALSSLLPKLRTIAADLRMPLELIVVDDNSPDGTADYAASFESTEQFVVRVVRRPGKFGQASAVIEGWSSSRGNYLGVMDADGAHDERVLKDLLEALVEGPAELAVGSRLVAGGSMGDWPFRRRLLSYGAIMLGRPLCPARDVTSSFMLFRREVLEGVSLDAYGLKVGLEVMVRGRYRTFTEIPYLFTARGQGGGTLRINDVLSYLWQLGSLFSYRHRHPHQRRRWTRVVA